MSVPVPNLDDRDFTDLVADALQRIRQLDPAWTDLSVHDPGVVLLEGFAHLTDILLYRLNRVPDKLFATFLNLLGTSLGPPAAATVDLDFSRPKIGRQVLIPRGTRVTCPPGLPGAPTPVFVTLADATMTEGQLSLQVSAAHVVLHDDVTVGTGSGGPGQSFVLPTTPLVAGEGVQVGIQVPDATAASGQAVVRGGKTYRICREVQVFADARPGEAVYRLDRSSGVLSFSWYPPGSRAPVVPGAGMAVLVSYRTGGGESGNVPAGTLTLLRDPLPEGIKVTNPAPATGGRDAEELADALRRGPADFQARDRAVTASDYEVLATRNGGVARAHAVARREAWAFAGPGEVEVVLVPHVPHNQRPQGRVTREALAANAREQVRAEVAAHLAERATIGAKPVVAWGNYKQVAVDARVVVRPDENPDAVRERILTRLARTINPIPDPDDDTGAGFGRPLRVSNLYRVLEQAEPGVQYVDQLRLEIAEMPDTNATDLVRADGQPGTWFVAQGTRLFRTTNYGQGWETCGDFAPETVRAVTTWPAAVSGRGRTLDLPGHVAIATYHGEGCRIRVSTDLGTTWQTKADLGFGVNDLVWLSRAGTPALLVAGTKGLFEISMAPGAVPVPNLVDPKQPDRGFHAVSTFTDIRGQVGVVLAAEAAGGVWLSSAGGAPDSFRLVRPPGEDIRSLSVQYDGPRVFLWAPRAVPEGDGAGAIRLAIDELGAVDIPTLAGQWQELVKGWTGGSCWVVSVVGDTAYAASQSGGVLALRLGTADPTWSAPDVNCGLPLRDRRRFTAFSGVSGTLLDAGDQLLLASGAGGVHRSRDGGQSWRPCSARVVSDVVTLPPSWLNSVLVSTGSRWCVAMASTRLRDCLPQVIAAGAEAGPLAALLAAADGMPQPVFEILDHLEEWFSPTTAPDPMVCFLASWVDLDWLTLPESTTRARSTLPGGTAPLRDLLLASAELASRRGTAGGMVRFLEIATGRTGFVVEDAGDFHLCVRLPAEADHLIDTVQRIVAATKPAHVTAEVFVAPTEPTRPRAPAAPGTDHGGMP